MGSLRRCSAFGLPGLLAMAAAAAGARGADAAPPSQAAEETVSLAATFGGALDRLLLDGRLKADAFRLWREAGCGFRKIELAAWIVESENADISLIDWPRRGLAWKEVWRGPLPPRVVGIIHTHPDEADPRPSEKDAATARAFGVPNYAVSRRGIWKARPDGETVQVDGEAWLVRCAGPAGCGVNEPVRVAVARRDPRPPDVGGGSP